MSILSIINWFTDLEEIVKVLFLLFPTGAIWFAICYVDNWVHRNDPDDFEQ
jgi:hypothetical protein